MENGNLFRGDLCMVAVHCVKPTKMWPLNEKKQIHFEKMHLGQLCSLILILLKCS